MNAFSSVIRSFSRLFRSRESAATRGSDSVSRPRPTSPSSARKSRSERQLKRAESKADTRLFYLVYRVPHGQEPDWDCPVGGLAMPLDDFGLALSVGYERYHIGPHEKLWFLEVRAPQRRALAAFYHRQWEVEMRQWLEAKPV